MPTKYLIAAVLLATTSTPVFAQVADGVHAQLATPPGFAIGSASFSPRLNNPTDIVLAATASTITSAVPPPAVGNDTVTRDYLRAARVALVEGRAGEAKQSLELAQKRALDQASAPGQTVTPNTSVFIARIIDARRALDSGDSHYAIVLIDVALVH